MEEANRVTAYLKATAEFYDPDATPETVRACVKQDLEDAGYEVEVSNVESQIERDFKDFVSLVTGERYIALLLMPWQKRIGWDRRIIK